ncbi:mucin-2-like [Paramacrobiotus metropolitanus]|uniref:mucin-2-like n=1 Tax=Paramacrobiotus metropolitanus TaxID=2943436 RepID=UPI0024460597|nr:mucin-2-like [Paramacrobiotus metropolitanus]
MRLAWITVVALLTSWNVVCQKTTTPIKSIYTDPCLHCIFDKAACQEDIAAHNLNTTSKIDGVGSSFMSWCNDGACMIKGFATGPNSPYRLQWRTCGRHRPPMTFSDTTWFICKKRVYSQWDPTWRNIECFCRGDLMNFCNGMYSASYLEEKFNSPEFKQKYLDEWFDFGDPLPVPTTTTPTTTTTTATTTTTTTPTTTTTTTTPTTTTTTTTPTTTTTTTTTPTTITTTTTTPTTTTITSTTTIPRRYATEKFTEWVTGAMNTCYRCAASAGCGDLLRLPTSAALFCETAICALTYNASGNEVTRDCLNGPIPLSDIGTSLPYLCRRSTDVVFDCYCVQSYCNAHPVAAFSALTDSMYATFPLNEWFGFEPGAAYPTPPIPTTTASPPPRDATPLSSTTEAKQPLWIKWQQHYIAYPVPVLYFSGYPQLGIIKSLPDG